MVEKKRGKAAAATRKRERRQPSESVLLAEVESQKLKIRIVGRVLTILASAAPLVLVWKIAQAIAGRQTVFNVSISIALFLTFSATTTISIFYIQRLQKENQQLRDRQKELEEKLLVRYNE